jgi:membrane protease YdiL (CAAX protease family)
LQTEAVKLPARNEPLPIDPSTGAPPSTLRYIFFGVDGLRAGWSLLLFIAIIAAAFWGITALNPLLHLAPIRSTTQPPATLRFVFLSESLPIVATLLATWIMSKIERRPNSVYGLGGSRRLPLFVVGAVWGVAFLSFLCLILWKTGLLVVDSRTLIASDALRYGAVWFLGFVLVGFFEEYLTRGYLLFTLTRGIAGIYKWIFKTRHSKTLGFWTASILIALFFGLSHGKNPNESPIGLLSAGLASLVFCLSLWRTGSLWWAIGFHAAWDWAQSFLYGVSDSGIMIQQHLLATHPLGKLLMSGGATGPEGSIFVLFILALVSLVIVFTLPRTNQGYASHLPSQTTDG